MVFQERLPNDINVNTKLQCENKLTTMKPVYWYTVKRSQQENFGRKSFKQYCCVLTRKGKARTQATQYWEKPSRKWETVNWLFQYEQNRRTLTSH